MALGPPVVLATLLLEDEDLVGARLLEDGSLDRGLLDEGCADGGGLALLADHHHVAQFHAFSGLTGQLFHADHVVLGDTVLFSAGLDDCEHCSFPKRLMAKKKPKTLWRKPKATCAVPRSGR